MESIKNNKHLFLKIFSSFTALLFLFGCDSNPEANAPQAIVAQPVEIKTVAVPEVPSLTEAQPQIENKSYLFVVKDHSIDELESICPIYRIGTITNQALELTFMGENDEPYTIKTNAYRHFS